MRKLLLILLAAALVGGGAFVFIAMDDDDEGAQEAEPTETTEPATTTTLDRDLAGIRCDTEAPESADADRKTYDEPPAVLGDPGRKYRATFTTNCGDIVAELDPSDPLQSAAGINNFVFLAREGFYDGLTWHRVISDFFIQSGSPGGDPAGSAGYRFGGGGDVPEGMTYSVGDLAYANAGADPSTSGSQFFIVTGESGTASLNPQPVYIKFGKVVEGLDVARRIAAFQEGIQDPSRPVYIVKVTIEEA